MIIASYICVLTGVYSGEKMVEVFAYESSEIDWCEDNYKHSEHVVEYFNTVSSVYCNIYDLYNQTPPTL